MFGRIRTAGTEWLDDWWALLKAEWSTERIVEILSSEGRQTQKAWAKTVKERLESGSSLLEAWSSCKGLLESHEIQRLEAEKSRGTFLEGLKKTIDDRRKSDEQKGELLNILIYPVIICLTAFVVLVFMGTWVIPKFETILKKASGEGNELPWITQIVFQLVHIDGAVILFWGGVVISVPVLLFQLRKKIRIIDATFDWAIFRLPYLGSYLCEIRAHRICQNLGILLESEVPWERACLSIAERESSFVNRQRFKELAKEVSEGGSPAQLLAEVFCFDLRTYQNLLIGENGGDLAGAFSRSEQLLRIKIEKRRVRMTRLLEPALVLGLASGIIIMMLALLLPLIQMAEKLSL